MTDEPTGEPVEAPQGVTEGQQPQAEPPWTRLTVFLTPDGRAALARLSELTGYSQTDSLGRALALAVHVAERHEDGWEPALQRDGEIEPIVMTDKTSP